MKRKIRLQTKIGITLLISAVAMVALVYLFQIRLLEPMYEANKIKTVRLAADQIEQAMSDGTTAEEVYNVSMQNDLCVRVISDSGEDYTAGNMGCKLYHMDSVQLLEQIYNAQVNDNEYLDTVTDNDGDGPDAVTGVRSIILTRILEVNGTQSVLMVYANVTPVDATVSTLKTQLWYVALIIAALMVAVTVYMTKFIARPLNRITAAAKTLPEGRYEEATGTNEYAEAQDLNQTLAQAAVDIQKADKAKRDLIGNVSHDLRTPLTMISGYAELMQDFPDQNNQENLQTIIDESHRLTVLVNDLLDLSKLQGSQIELKYSDFDLDRMLQDELRKYEVYVAKEGFQITYQGCEGLQVHADEERIKQVFNNFMTNAINYSGKARQIEVRLSREGQMAHVEVQDHGEGIPEDKLKDIWDRYYKVDTTHVRAVQGSGIGLSIVKEILSLHQVPYGVRSKVNEGSTFWFELPLTGQKEAGSK